MDHIYFEAQLCSEIATLKEKSKKLKICETSFDWWRQHQMAALDTCCIWLLQWTHLYHIHGHSAIVTTLAPRPLLEAP